MEYEFLAEDGKRYLESDAAPHSTASICKHVGVLTRLLGFLPPPWAGAAGDAGVGAFSAMRSGNDVAG